MPPISRFCTKKETITQGDVEHLEGVDQTRQEEEAVARLRQSFRDAA